MFVILRVLTVIALAAATVGCSAGAKTRIERRAASVDWGAARSTMASQEGGDKTTVRSAGAIGARVPVLALRETRYRGAPKIVVQDGSYVATYELGNASVFVTGSPSVLETGAHRTVKLPDADEVLIERTEDALDATFARYGVAYMLRLSCDLVTDERCANEKYLRSLVEELVIVGGEERDVISGGGAPDPSIVETHVAAAEDSLGHEFTFKPAGELEPNSGDGQISSPNYFPTMRFPLENEPAYLNSQVYRPGGSHAPNGGSQCDGSNYSYPWRDNFCEARQWTMPLCPAGRGHQGQDIRPATCAKDTHWAVAIEDGVIAQIGSYSVTLQSADGTLFRYLHLNKDSLKVRVTQRVKKGDRIGYVSNWFGGDATTIHLHFDAKTAVAVSNTSSRFLFVSPYASLVESYKRLLAAD
jgi:hypothetical protein